MAIMNDAEIVYAISTGDSTYEEKIRLLRSQIESIKKSERERIANKIIKDEVQK